MPKTRIMGIDVGYSHVKTVTDKGKDSFRSTVREGIIDINAGSTVINYEGRDLTIGEHGRVTVDANKIDDPNFLPLIFAAILRNSDRDMSDININLVTGLPIGWYPKQKGELTNKLADKQFKVCYNDRDVNIHIKQCIVFPQSAGLALNNPDDFKEDMTNLVIDIGGVTVDVSYYEGRKLVSSRSYRSGMILLYAKLTGAISSDFNVDVNDQDVERFIRQRSVTINEEEKDFDFDSYFNRHIDSIITEIKKDFPYDIVHKKTFVGGGSLTLKDYLPKNNGIKSNEIQFNAEAFYSVGLQKYE